MGRPYLGGLVNVSQNVTDGGGEGVKKSGKVRTLFMNGPKRKQLLTGSKDQT
jgi:hypothetical protein